MTKPKTRSCLNCEANNNASRKTCISCYASLLKRKSFKEKEKAVRTGDWGQNTLKHRNGARVVASAHVTIHKHLNLQKTPATQLHCPPPPNLIPQTLPPFSLHLSHIPKQTLRRRLDDIDAGRESLIKGLCIYLNENPDVLVQEYMDMTEATALSAIEKTTVGIYIFSDVGIIIEGVVVLQDLGNVALATALLFGLFYSLNMRYPSQLRYTDSKGDNGVECASTLEESPKLKDKTAPVRIAHCCAHEAVSSR